MQTSNIPKGSAKKLGTSQSYKVKCIAKKQTLVHSIYPATTNNENRHCHRIENVRQRTTKGNSPISTKLNPVEEMTITLPDHINTLFIYPFPFSIVVITAISYLDRYIVLIGKHSKLLSILASTTVRSPSRQLMRLFIPWKQLQPSVQDALKS
jgi:hypothetical protein